MDGVQLPQGYRGKQQQKKGKLKEDNPFPLCAI